MNRPDLLTDERFARGQRWRNYAEFLDEIESWSSELTADECEAKLNATGVPCSIYNAPQDLFAHPQVLERTSFRELDDQVGNFFIQNAPFRFADADISTAAHYPGLGQHTDEILMEKLNLTAGDILELRDGGVVS